MPRPFFSARHPAVMHFMDLLLHRFGYGAVALFMVAEGCGIPLPAETMMITAAAFAARGTLSLWGVGVAGALGGIVGGSAGYGIGAWGGIPLLRRYGARVGIDSARIERATRFYQRRGAWAAFAGRFLAFLRLIVPMVAGVTGMPFLRFSLANAAGAILSAALYCGLGYQFGRDLPALRRHMLVTTLVVLGLLVLVATVAMLRNRGRAVRDAA